MSTVGNESFLSSVESELIGTQTYTATAPLNGNTIAVDSAVVLPDEVWLVDSASLILVNTFLAGPVGMNPPDSGIYLCASGTQTPFPIFPSGDITLALALQQFVLLPMLVTSALTTFKPFSMPPGSFLRGVYGETYAAHPTFNNVLQLSFSVVRKKVGACGC